VTNVREITKFIPSKITLRYKKGAENLMLTFLKILGKFAG